MNVPMQPTSFREPPEWLAPLGRNLAEALPRLHGVPPDPLVGELIAALTAALERGELEVSLAGPAPEGVTAEGWPGLHRRALERSPLSQDPDGPLDLEGDQLRWRRWQRQRRAVLEALVDRAATPPTAVLSPNLPLRQDLEVLLDASQRRAVAAVLNHGLVLLEGGPGTGKTSTVAGMVRAMREQVPGARIHLAAPTGKAAARLRSTTGPDTPCTTLHRLLESRGNHFGRNRHHPLALDLLVVDEVSMVDMALMSALLEALPDRCRLVLVGDPAQLAPVGPGPVLLELQRPEWRQALGAAVITLGTPYRNDGAIATITAALRQSGQQAPDPIAVIRPLLENLPSTANLRWLEASPLTLPTELLRRLDDHRLELASLATTCSSAGTATKADTAAMLELLRLRDRLLVLSPLRKGRWGLEAIHGALLGDRIGGPLATWPAGLPVLCRRNLPELGLANGDVGILLGPQSAPDQRRVLFGDGGARERGEATGFTPQRLHPAQLAGAVEPALALTVHKAQGSEAEEVIVLLPARGHLDPGVPYTALTRARRRALLITPREDWSEACVAAGSPLTNQSEPSVSEQPKP